MDDGLVKLMQSFGTFGVVIWILWYILKTMLPKMIEGIQAENVATRQAFSSELAAMRDTFSKEAEAQRTTFSSELSKMRSDFTVEIRRLSSSIDRQNLVLVSMAGKPGLVHLLEDYNTEVEEQKKSA